MQDDVRPIGVFDSGLGGLTVARAIASGLPHESITYLGDTKRCPYGPRDQSEVRRFVAQVGAWLDGRDVKAVVIACNTATAAALDLLQVALPVPVIGVVEPGARAAVRATRTRRVGVLATEGTVRSGSYEAAIHALDAGVRVFSHPAPRFVELVEGLLIGGEHLHEDWMANPEIFDTPPIRNIAREETEALAGMGIDTVVLGCTHFPLLARPIRAVLGDDVRIVSSAEETCRELRESLEYRGDLAPDDQVPDYRFATTSDDITSFAVAGNFIFGHALESIERVDLDRVEPLPDYRNTDAGA